MEQSQDIPAAAPSSKQDLMEKHQTTTTYQTNQPRLESSTNSDGKIILRMAGSKKSSTPVNGVPSPAPPIESTETPDDSKEVKIKKKRERKPKIHTGPIRRSERRTSAITEEPKINSMEPSSQATDAGKSKSRATLTKSISPPPASNTSTNGVNKRVLDELDQAESIPSITEEEIEYSYRKSSNVPLPASKRRKLLQQQRSTVSPSTRNSEENSPSSSEKSGSSSGSGNMYDQPYIMNPFFDHHFAFPVDDYEDSLRNSSAEASNPPSSPASPSSSTGAKGKAPGLVDELRDSQAASISQNIEEVPALEARGGGSFPSGKVSPSASPSPSIRGGNVMVSMDGASDREVSEAVVEPSETASVTQNPPPKKRGRPAAANPRAKKAASKAAPKSILKKPAPPGRRKKTSENARVQAAYDRMVDLKKSYREITKGLKPALAMIADRDLDLMAEDPIAHEKVPEYKTVMHTLDSTHCSRIAMLNQSHDTQLQFAETQHRQAAEYSNIQFKCAIQDILNRSLARAKEAFVTTYDAGVQQDILEDDNISVDENRDVHLRDLNAFNVHEDDDTSSIDMEQPGTSTPLKSQSKNRGPNSLLDLPLAAPIAKHSLLAVPQEQEPSSLPPSRVATPEIVDNGKFDEYGVHIPNRIRRGRMVEPNNRAIVKSWIEYDPWDIQYEIMGSKKKARIQSGKKTELTYLDQTSFTNQGGGGYKLSNHRSEDFDQNLIKLYGLHPSYGIPIKGSTNHVDLSKRTDFSRTLGNTQPIVVVDVEETRPVSPGGTRKPAELSEPLILGRSTSMIYANQNFDQFLNRHRVKDVLDQSGAGIPSVEGFATYDAEVRDEQKAQDGVAELLEADRIAGEISAKEASAAAAAAAANIAHKSSIHAIVNSDDGDLMSSTSRINRHYQTNIKMKATHQPVSVAGFDALNEAINIKAMHAPQLPPGGYFYGPRAIDYGLQPREYIPQDGFAERGMPPPPQPYVQQQTTMHQQLPPPQQVMSYNTGAHSQRQQQIQMQPQAISYNNAAPAQPQHQMMQTLHSQTMAPIPSSPYYTQPSQGQAMVPATRGYPQFNHYVPPQQRTSEQAPSQASQASSRSHRELRPMPPQNGIEWVAKHNAAHFYRNSSPLPASQAPQPPPAPTSHYQPPNSFGFWTQQNQQGASPSQSPPQQHSQAPTQQGPPMHQSPHPQQQQQQPLLLNPHPFASGPADISSNGPAVNHYPREDDSHQKKSTQNQPNPSKRGRKK